MNKILEKIKTRGYWEVLIRPGDFVENRIEPIRKCHETVRELAVQWRGWPYPCYEIKTRPTTATDHIEQAVDSGFHIEFWRYYQSGQFAYFLSMREDWLAEEKSMSLPPISPGAILWITTAVWSFTEIYEFASRLASKGLLGDTCRISVALHGTNGRTLSYPQEARLLYDTYTCDTDPLPHDITISTPDLMARSSELALEHAVWTFHRFNWHLITPKGLKQVQDELLSGKQ